MNSAITTCFLFLIFVLPWTCFGQKAKDIRRINFERVKYPVSSDLEQEDLSVEKTVFGDLNADQKEEAAVIVRWSYNRIGGRGFGYYVYVYTLKNGKLTLLTKMNGGSKEELFMVKDIAIKNNLLEVHRCEADKNFHNFSLATIFYQMKNGKFSDVKRLSQPVEEQCYIGE